jgi:hypothetical protein
MFTPILVTKSYGEKISFKKKLFSGHLDFGTTFNGKIFPPRQGAIPVREGVAMDFFSFSQTGIDRQAIWGGVSTYSLKFHAGPPTLIRPAGRPPPKRPYGRLGGGPPTGRAACGHLLPPWIPLPVQACKASFLSVTLLPDSLSDYSFD